VIVPPKEFFQFCAKHVSLLRELEQRASGTDLSDAEINHIVKVYASDAEEQPSFIAERLKELRILIASDQSAQYFLMAEPVRAILRYLLEEAKPVSSEIVQSYVNKLQKLAQNLRDAMAAENSTLAELALTDITQLLRNLHDALSATHVSVLAEVARFKTDKRPSSIREKYQRIIWWMQQYIAPMIDIIRVDAAMQATFTELEAILEAATTDALLVSIDAAERNLRLVRLTRRHALNVFDQSEKEISPLYRSLARSSNLAAGAAWALDLLRLGPFDQWTQKTVVGVFSLRKQEAFSDRAIIGAIERVLHNPPAPPPAIDLERGSRKPAALEYRRWLNSLPGDTVDALPINDLLAWLTVRYPELETAQILMGFSTLFLDRRFQAGFSADAPIQTYETRQHFIRAHPVRLRARK
jgi:hypothetical protein